MYKRLKNKRDINEIHYLTAANKFSPRTVNSQFFSAWLDATNTGGLLGSSLLSKIKIIILLFHFKRPKAREIKINMGEEG